MLALLVGIISAINTAWILRDQAPMPIPDSYFYMMKLLEFVDNPGVRSVSGLWSSLGELGFAGRPPLYQLITVPFVFIFGRSEEAAISVNVVFLAILVLATYSVARLIRDRMAGLLAAVLVVSYPPIIHLSRMYLPYAALAACCALAVWLALLLIRDRSIKLAWVFGASLAFGLLIHSAFLWVALSAVSVFGTYMFLFNEAPKYPVGIFRFPAWLAGKVRDRFFLHGLVPGALISVGLILPWYATWGSELYGLRQALPGLTMFRRAKIETFGFQDIEPSFWWYVETAPGAISYPLGVLAALGFLFIVARRRGPAVLLAFVLLLYYVAISAYKVRYVWWSAVPLLFFAAVFTAVWVASIRRRWLSACLATLCVAVAAFNYSFVTWGGQAWSRSLAVAMGARVDSETCQRARINCAFCPDPAQEGRWPVARITRLILDDPECRQEQPCQLMVYPMEGLRHVVFDHYLVRERLETGLVAINPLVDWAEPDNMTPLLKSDYLIYPDHGPPPPRDDYYVATLRFLKDPPATFAEAHERVGSYQLPIGRNAVLIKRVKPLTAEEAEVSVEALELSEQRKSKKYDLLGSLFLAEGNLEKAAELYEGALLHGGARSRGKARRTLVDIYSSLGRKGKVVDLYLGKLKANPNDIASRVLLAESYVKRGETEAAIAELETAIALGPERARPRRVLAGIYHSREQFDRAIELYREVLEIKPGDLVARVRLGQAYSKVGNVDAAIAELETAVVQEPDSSWPHRALAEVYRSQGRTDQAVAHFKDALEIDPHDIQARVRLADTHKKAGNTTAAVAELETAIGLAPDNTWPRRALASVYWSVGEKAQAAAIFEEVLEMDPQDNFARNALVRIQGAAEE